MSTDDVEQKTYTPKYLSRYTNAQYEYLFKNAPVPENKVIQSEEESEFEDETGDKRRRIGVIRKPADKLLSEYYRLRPPLIDAPVDKKRAKTEEEQVVLRPPTPDASKNNVESKEELPFPKPS